MVFCATNGTQMFKRDRLTITFFNPQLKLCDQVFFFIVFYPLSASSSPSKLQPLHNPTLDKQIYLNLPFPSPSLFLPLVILTAHKYLFLSTLDYGLPKFRLTIIPLKTSLDVSESQNGVLQTKLFIKLVRVFSFISQHMKSIISI